MRSLLFVYGSLKRDGCYHAHLEHADYLGSHICLPRYTMLDLGQYPGVIDQGHTGIHGEVYRIDGATLYRIDVLEDTPNTYRRRLIDTRFGRAWMYIYQLQRGDEPVVADGIWQPA